jgi:DNA-binding NarL/FixJ family response regulator
MIRVIAADDHQMFLDGIDLIFSSVPDIRIICRALNGKELVSLAGMHKPDVVLLDLNMPEMNGAEAIPAIKNSSPLSRIIVVSMYHTREIVNNIMRMGVHGYLLKNTGKDELIEAVRKVHQGGTSFGDFPQPALSVAGSDPDPLLSDREIQIIRLLADGLNNDEIGAKLFLSPHTVKTHRKNIHSRLNINTTAELIRYASAMGWI